MITIKKYGLLFSLTLLLLPLYCRSAGEQVINEIAWMGTTASASDEWIELKNTGDQPVDLSGWTLSSADAKLHVSLDRSIPARGFYLLERTDDTSVAGISADLIYTGALSNAGEGLALNDRSGAAVDTADFSSGWPAGDSTSKKTMERTEGGWITSKDPGGTPKAENDAGAAAVPPAESVVQKTYQRGVVINELLPNPKAADEENEWIELYNTAANDINVGGWILKDEQGSSTAYRLPQGTVIKKDEYLVVGRPASKITLNNEGDAVALLAPDNTQMSRVSYPKAPLDQSYNREQDTWQWSSKPTPGTGNQISSGQTGVLPSESKPGNNETVKNAQLAAVGAKASVDRQANNPFVFFFVVLGASIILGAATLFIIIKKHHVRSQSL
jgi:hypothetical protein